MQLRDSAESRTILGQEDERRWLWYGTGRPALQPPLLQAGRISYPLAAAAPGCCGVLRQRSGPWRCERRGGALEVRIPWSGTIATDAHDRQQFLTEGGSAAVSAGDSGVLLIYATGCFM